MKISNEMTKLFKIAASSDASVLITGQTGTGKTTLARQIHEASSRSGRPFVSINLATLSEGVLESELFGHEKGAFTGADSKRVGKLEMSQGGTVLLDEISELPLRLQARLLEFLQSKVVTPVGSNRQIQLNVRIIAATHRDLQQAVKQGTFREDLFHRLRVVPIEMKSLQERDEEFDTLVHDCLSAAAQSAGKVIHKLTPEVASQFEAYSWPGNLRELRNVLEFAVLSAEEGEVRESDLPQWFSQSLLPGAEMQASPLGVAEIPLTFDYLRTLERFEKEYLTRALARNGGRINRTARQIGVNKTTLIRRIRTHQLTV